MERRNRSLKALEELTYIDSLDSEERANALIKWYDKYLTNEKITDFDLEQSDLKVLLELFYKNISFLKKYKEETRQNMISNKKMKNFLNH